LVYETFSAAAATAAIVACAQIFIGIHGSSWRRKQEQSKTDGTFTKFYIVNDWGLRYGAEREEG
jgi:hypothetical protein